MTEDLVVQDSVQIAAHGQRLNKIGVRELFRTQVQTKERVQINLN